MSTDRGDWMQTYTGRKFYPLDPQPEDIVPEDIAHALGNICRYGGHVDRFYSVAEHCYLLSYSVRPQHALEALLHDATEAYVGDMVRPLKQALPDYQIIEKNIWRAIAERFNVQVEIAAEVHDADFRIMLNERKVLMKNAKSPAPWQIDEMEPVMFNKDHIKVVGAPSLNAKNLYMYRLDELWRP